MCRNGHCPGCDLPPRSPSLHDSNAGLCPIPCPTVQEKTDPAGGREAQVGCREGSRPNMQQAHSVATFGHGRSFRDAIRFPEDGSGPRWRVPNTAREVCHSSVGGVGPFCIVLRRLGQARWKCYPQYPAGSNLEHRQSDSSCPPVMIRNADGHYSIRLF